MGKIIAVIGIDGSGKSTFINKVGSPTKHFFKSNQNQIKNKNKKKSTKLFYGNSFRLLIGTIIKVYLPNIIIYLYYKLFTREIFIFDRYSYDFSGRLENNKFAHIILNLLFNHFPTPDYVVFLDIEPSIAFKRKEEHNIPFLTKKRMLLRRSTDHLSNSNKLIIINPISPIKFEDFHPIIADLMIKGFGKINPTIDSNIILNNGE